MGRIRNRRIQFQTLG